MGDKVKLLPLKVKHLQNELDTWSETGCDEAKQAWVKNQTKKLY